ncbi:MAG: tetrahydrofolate dehydrogenase/cyclohydrolase catalytic domain-containing protein [Bacillota bacterium]|nr:tetrahydrofolate dehydrogenase/cyclohydrolase catalytic domain-containing protein [Bacillota bacterium]
MAELLKGKPVADRITQDVAEKAAKLRASGIVPTLAIVRLGEDPGDLSYEKGAMKRASEAGVEVKSIVFPRDAAQEDLIAEIEKLNEDDSVHGVLMFRPLPKHIDEKAVCEVLDPAKDIDGITSGSLAGIFMDSEVGYPPCTAAACIELLDHYGIELAGKKVTVMGRSLVIGKPVAMMAMRKNATVTVCHSRTAAEDFAAAGAGADIVIAAIGKAKMINESMLGDGQTIIDVGINMDENGKLCGDVAFDREQPDAGIGARAETITPVPGGVGSVTTAVLMKHVIEAAKAFMYKNERED